MIWNYHDTAWGETWFCKWDVYTFRINPGGEYYQLYYKQGDDAMSHIGMFSSVGEAQYAAEQWARHPHLDVRGVE